MFTSQSTQQTDWTNNDVIARTIGADGQDTIRCSKFKNMLVIHTQLMQFKN